MTEVPSLCTCGETTRPNTSYCHRCGREFRQLCPACGEERRFLAAPVLYYPPWCGARKSPLYACVTCGRWLQPDADVCPDPDCGGRVGPTLPQHTGRRWDLRGGGVDWVWPERWDLQHPEHVSPVIDRWDSQEPMYGAAVAHGRLTVWSGAGLLVPPPEFSRVLPRSMADAPLSEGSEYNAFWNYRNGASFRPLLTVPFEDRIAVVGGALMLVTDRGFALAGMWHSRPERLELDPPLGQAASSHWWVGWTQSSDNSTQDAELYCAPVASDWDQVEPVHVMIPDGARLAGARRTALQNHHAYWVGQDSGVWDLDCREKTVSRVIEPADGASLAWGEADGPRFGREAGGQILVTGSAPKNGRSTLELHGGSGPLRGIYAAGSRMAVVGERITAFERGSGERISDCRIAGRFIAGALVPSEDGDARLLMLTRDGDSGQLRVLRLSSGKEELLWQERDVTPLAILPVGDSLYVVHKSGLVRFKEGAR